MRWENLSAYEFGNAVARSERVCVIPIGCIEKHGSHLPLGTDMMIARAVALQAAETEPFVVFPHYYFSQVAEVRAFPGTVAISSKLQMQLLEETCKEIRRNGFNKIILANSHGGNNSWLGYFVQTQLEERKDYAVYVYSVFDLFEDQLSDLRSKFETPNTYGHADYDETSLIMHVNPELVDMNRLTKDEWVSMNRLSWLKKAGAYTSTNWYADYPNHIAGDPTLANAEYGKMYLDYSAANFAKAVKAIKDDDTVLQLQNEFFDRCDELE